MSKIVLITGASRGIGASLAIEFAKNGYNLSLCCRNSKEDLYSLQKHIQDNYHVDVIMSITEWNNIINTNLSSVFFTSKCIIPEMIKKHSGKIINISSVWGNVGASCEVAYSACKGGINSFTKALGKELAPSNIQVNAIACGCIDTSMNSCFSEEERQELADEIPAGRFGKPEEVAHLALQLATGNEYLTGQIVTLDGGWI